MNDTCSTRQKLLETAGEVFAERGFHGATIRDICEKAGANIAAINYHFGDKERLYSEVFKYILEVDCQINPDSYKNCDDPKESLKLYIEIKIKKMLLPGKFSWKGTLMAREMVDPSPVLDEVVQNGIKPMAYDLYEIISNIINKPVDSKEVHLCGASVIGQIFFHKHGLEINKRLHPYINYDEESIKRLAEHIYKFSISALLGM
jgi:AcrR family transcriptional regulator